MIARHLIPLIKAKSGPLGPEGLQSQGTAATSMCTTGPPETTVPANQATLEVAMQLLFFVVALLLIADLHSSFVSGAAKWEANPLVAAIAETVGLPGALAITKLVDGLSLRLLYAIWKRTGAHVATATVLAIVALHYLPIVFDNYAG